MAVGLDQCFPRHAPPSLLSTVRTMDVEDGAYNPFSSSHVWNQTADNDALGTYESSLFTPLELDSRFRRVNRRTRVAFMLTVCSQLYQIRPPVCA